MVCSVHFWSMYRIVLHSCIPPFQVCHHARGFPICHLHPGEHMKVQWAVWVQTGNFNLNLPWSLREVKRFNKVTTKMLFTGNYSYTIWTTNTFKIWFADVYDVYNWTQHAWTIFCTLCLWFSWSSNKSTMSFLQCSCSYQLTLLTLQLTLANFSGNLQLTLCICSHRVLTGCMFLLQLVVF